MTRALWQAPFLLHTLPASSAAPPQSLHPTLSPLPAGHPIQHMGNQTGSSPLTYAVHFSRWTSHSKAPFTAKEERQLLPEGDLPTLPLPTKEEEGTAWLAQILAKNSFIHITLENKASQKCNCLNPKSFSVWFHRPFKRLNWIREASKGDF